jgi:hypothetical protein
MNYFQKFTPDDFSDEAICHLLDRNSPYSWDVSPSSLTLDSLKVGSLRLAKRTLPILGVHVLAARWKMESTCRTPSTTRS